MDDFEDHDVKELFGKLSGYESKINGVEWSTIESKLSAKLMPGLKAMSVLIIGGLLLFASWTGNEGAKGKSRPVTLNAVATENKIYKVKNDEPVRIEHVEERIVKAGSVDHAKSETIEAALVTSEKKLEEQSVPEASVELIVAPSVIKPTRHRIQFNADAYYLFGFVKPLGGDGRAVQDYISKPGFGLSLSANMPLRKDERNKFYVSASLNLLHKNADFQVSEFLSEQTTVGRVKSSNMVGYAGLGLTWSAQNWQVSSLVHLRASKEHALFAKSLVSLSIRKDLFQLGNSPYHLTIGSSLMIPVSNEAHYLRFMPALVNIGIRRK